MLIIDKTDDIKTLESLGANSKSIRNIFVYEGWLISSLGALIGLFLGLALCLIQENFGLIKLGNGVEYVISAYPVQVQVLDVVIVAVAVLAIGYITAWIPTRTIKKR